jgi:ubiquitin carboxyl-terminal hydrolase 4/11/15
LKSVEDRESQSPSDLPRFDLPTDEDGRPDSALPPRIPTLLQNSSSLSAADYISSAASSPSAAYAGLSIEGERGADASGSGTDLRASLEPTEQDTRRPSPFVSFSHRAIMGGAADLPHRSSSPLKRRASDLEAEDTSSQKDDVDMIQMPSGASNPPDTIEHTIQPSRPKRAQSIDMLREGNEVDVESGGAQHAANSEDEMPVVVNEKDGMPGSLDKSSSLHELTFDGVGVPSIEFQIRTVTTMIEAVAQEQIQDGAMVWLVSRVWLGRVISRGPEAMKASKTEPEGEIGPVDNSDIIQQIIKDCDGTDFVQLKHGLGSESFELLPKDAWDLVVQWYGLMPGSIPIVRYAHNTNADQYGLPNIIFEYHPPILTVHRLWSDHSNTLSQIIKAQNPLVPMFVVSRSDRYMQFLKKIKNKAGIDTKKKVRVWRVPRSQPASEPVEPSASVNTSTPPSSRPSSPSQAVAIEDAREPQDLWTTLLLDVATFIQLKKGDGRELIGIDDQTGNSNYNGKVDLSFAGLGDDQAIVLDEQIDHDSWVSNFVPKGQKTTAGRSSTSYIPNSQTNSGRNSPAPHHNTRSRVQKSGRSQGSVGLSNLGNTCYMNSALQCVRSVEELTKYFLTGVGEEELNADNPLGNGGHVAMAYEALLKEMYREPPPTSVAPRQFKNTIGKYAPSFSGYAQQDSQEFLGFLLDGLQEDLSRVKKKPYIEKPDSTDEMVNNPAAIREMAAQVWDITKKRDDSVIADLFTGMYKSTLVCPVCAKVSITFDPFNNVTLQLPVENNWSHGIYYMPLNDKPMMFTVDMDKQGSILAMKQSMSKKVGVPVEKLFVAEEFKSKFFKVHEDWEQAADVISANDNIIMYELEAKPTNWPAPRKPVKKQKQKSMLNFGGNYSNDSDEDEIPPWNDPLAERMLVPVFHRRPNMDRGRFKSAWTLVPVPHYIIVTPDEVSLRRPSTRAMLTVR